jgi:Ca-activated chloride channel family protein
MRNIHRALALAAATAVACLAWSHAVQADAVFSAGRSLGAPGDAAAPTVRLVAPADGAFVTGLTPLRAHVEPSDAAASVVFFVNGREVCRRTDAPFECEWDAGATIVSYQVRLVVNLRAGGRVVHTARTASVSFAETVDVDVVQVTVTVTDDRGRYVKGLPRSAFQVYEDGVAQPISHFYGDDAPLELVVALDLSTSIGPALPGMKRAVIACLSTLSAHHRVTLLGFNDDVFTLLPRTAEAAARERIVNTLSAWGMTALYEAVIEGVTMLGSRPGRKAMIVFTDGEDQGSHVTLKDVEQTLHSSDLILYMIGQGQGMASQPLTQLMDRLSIPTGGRTVSTTSIEKLQNAFDDLFDEMSHQYVLGYQAPSGASDDRWREIEVKVDGGYKVRARQGYRTGR